MRNGGHNLELSALVKSQISADQRRGFQVDFDSDADRVRQMEKDIVGLIGEVGEFSNVLKKVSLAISHAGYEGPSLAEVAPNMREELADTMIYLIRLSAVLGGDLETDLVRKMRVNDERYRSLER
jgi:NTP pyrophosphatase (non-canonical NTP hydrolase)